MAAFESALQSASRSPSELERTQQLSEAVDLYNGPLLPGHYEDWVLIEQQRLDALFLDALLRLTRQLEQTGDTDAALEHARRAVCVNPLREETHREAIRLLVAAGQTDAALRLYHEMERILSQDLGEAPSPAARGLLCRIEERIARGQPPPPLPSPAPPAAVPQARLAPRRQGARTALPTGTVTFLLTEIEGSIALSKRAGTAFDSARLRHQALLRREFARHGGHVFQEPTDRFLVAFAGAGDALACAVACQRTLANQAWPEETGALGVRIALHTGDIEQEKGGYQGPVLHHASRVLAAAHPGQILISEATAILLRPGALGALEPDVRLAEPGRVSSA